jgi:hypothetical protein
MPLEELISQPAVILALTGGAAIVMSVLGMREGFLRIRAEPRRCPSCGRRLRSWTCWACTRRARGT